MSQYVFGRVRQQISFHRKSLTIARVKQRNRVPQLEGSNDVSATFYNVTSRLVPLAIGVATEATCVNNVVFSLSYIKKKNVDALQCVKHSPLHALVERSVDAFVAATQQSFVYDVKRRDA
jgi:hypothetical protein